MNLAPFRPITCNAQVKRMELLGLPRGFLRAPSATRAQSALTARRAPLLPGSTYSVGACLRVPEATPNRSQPDSNNRWAWLVAVKLTEARCACPQAADRRLLSSRPVYVDCPVGSGSQVGWPQQRHKLRKAGHLHTKRAKPERLPSIHMPRGSRLTTRSGIV